MMFEIKAVKNFIQKIFFLRYTMYDNNVFEKNSQKKHLKNHKLTIEV